jgi:hypothetical protein
MNKIIVKSGLLILAGVIISLGMFSCRKELPTIVKISVVDTSGAAFPNAMVRLYPTPTIGDHGAIIIDDTMYTDLTGVATFDYTEMYNLGQAGVAVLDIEVRSGDTLYGTGIIKIEQEETSEEMVILQP